MYSALSEIRFVGVGGGGGAESIPPMGKFLEIILSRRPFLKIEYRK